MPRHFTIHLTNIAYDYEPDTNAPADAPASLTLAPIEARTHSIATEHAIEHANNTTARRITRATITAHPTPTRPYDLLHQHAFHTVQHSNHTITTERTYRARADQSITLRVSITHPDEFNHGARTRCSITGSIDTWRADTGWIPIATLYTNALAANQADLAAPIERLTLELIGVADALH